MMKINIDKRKVFDNDKKEKAMIDRERRVSKSKFEDDMASCGIQRAEREYKMTDSTFVIQNIVYARDPKIFDTKNNLVN